MRSPDWRHKKLVLLIVHLKYKESLCTLTGKSGGNGGDQGTYVTILECITMTGTILNPNSTKGCSTTFPQGYITVV